MARHVRRARLHRVGDSGLRGRMGSESFFEVYRAHRDLQSRYIYTLLAAAAAAIGFAVTQTQTATLGWSHAPLAAAVICWAVSFYCGCRHLGFAISGLYANAMALDAESGRYQPSPELTADTKSLHELVKTTGAKASDFANWQLRLLIWGSVAFIVWHVGQMYLRALDPARGIFL
jgi:hypothetical protein